MREIKFRGKRLDNGEWEYGDLLQYDDGSVCIWKIQCKLPPKTKRFCPLVLK